MHKFKILFLFIVLSFLIFPSSFSFDWLKLHRQSENISVDEAKKLASNDSNSISKLYILALSYLRQHKDKEAEKTFDRILKINSSNLAARWGKIECLRRKHKCNDCKKELKKIIAENPDFAPAYMTLAYLYYVEMQFDEVTRLCSRLIKMGKANVDQENYVRALGLFSGAKGMIAHYGGPISKIINGRSVMPYLKKAEKIAPDSPIVYFGFGSYYLLIPHIFGRNLEKAEKYLQKSIKADPNFANTYVRLAQVYRAQGKEDKYQQYLKKALAIDPKNELALDIKSRKCDFICVD